MDRELYTLSGLSLPLFKQPGEVLTAGFSNFDLAFGDCKNFCVNEPMRERDAESAGFVGDGVLAEGNNKVERRAALVGQDRLR